jgi:hypothetical protein
MSKSLIIHASVCMYIAYMCPVSWAIGRIQTNVKKEKLLYNVFLQSQVWIFFLLYL